jgi:hypothetical protein
MKVLDRQQLATLGFLPPEGPCIANNGRLLRYYIWRNKPWLGVEEYLSPYGDGDEADVEVYAVNYGTHRIEPIRTFEDIQVFLVNQY